MASSTSGDNQDGGKVGDMSKGAKVVKPPKAPKAAKATRADAGGNGGKAATNGQARFRVAVFALIERDGRYLLARRSDIGWWNLPGGGLEYNESLAEGMAREVQEEVQLAVTVGQLVGVYEKPLKREVVFAFRCHLIDPDATPGLSDEVSEVGWFAPDALPEQTLHKHAQRVRDAALQRPEALIPAQATSTDEDQRRSPGDS